MLDLVNRALDVVRTSNANQAGWQEIVGILDNEEAKSLPEPSFEKDLQAMDQWLLQQLNAADTPQPGGIYFGLGETLDARGKVYVTIEIAMSEAVDSTVLNSDWITRCSWYGRPTRIEGTGGPMTCIHQSGRQMGDAHYIVPLGYAGLLLSASLARIRLRRPALVMWGFHDGDMFYLGRSTAGKFERICQCE